VAGGAAHGPVAGEIPAVDVHGAAAGVGPAAQAVAAVAAVALELGAAVAALAAGRLLARQGGMNQDERAVGAGDAAAPAVAAPAAVPRLAGQADDTDQFTAPAVAARAAGGVVVGERGLDGLQGRAGRAGRPADTRAASPPPVGGGPAWWTRAVARSASA
jgi:hypothetical protein